MKSYNAKFIDILIKDIILLITAIKVIIIIELTLL